MHRPTNAMRGIKVAQDANSEPSVTNAGNLLGTPQTTRTINAINVIAIAAIAIDVIAIVVTIIMTMQIERV